MKLIYFIKNKFSDASLTKKLTYVLLVLSFMFGILTYVTLTGQIIKSIKSVTILLNIDLVLFMLLFLMLMRGIVKTFLQKKKKEASSKLKLKLVFFFGVVAATPAIIVSLFSASFFNLAMQEWFSDKINNVVEETLNVANAYLKEHRQTIAGETLFISNNINSKWFEFSQNMSLLNGVLEKEIVSKGLDEAVVFNRLGKVVARAGFNLSLRFEEVPFWALEQAEQGDVAILTGGSMDRIRALVKLNFIEPLYLYIGRFVDPKVLVYIDNAKMAVNDYKDIEKNRSNIEFTFNAIFILASMLLIVASMILGFGFANQLTNPIADLIDVLEKIKKGDLSARVKEPHKKNDMYQLCFAFNKMTEKLQEQRDELIVYNKEIDERRRFIEAVLSGVSSGVISVDVNGNLQVYNLVAAELLDKDLMKYKGVCIKKILKEFYELINEIKKKQVSEIKKEINLNDKKFFVTLTTQNNSLGFIFTFDDITELVNAQKKAAWSDVARRIAHEIKNPLTPIQLSAERLKRKYLNQITQDEEAFVKCTDTIVRQVKDIGMMVDEFSSFARMAAPVLLNENLGKIINDEIFVQKSAYPEIMFVFNTQNKDISMLCDKKQMGRLFNNIFKNAIEAIKIDNQKDGIITINLLKTANKIKIEITDNGIGFPIDNRDKLLEPYVTNKEKGTGLGLAIVQKIVQDHNGKILLTENKNKGAKIILEFKV